MKVKIKLLLVKFFRFIILTCEINFHEHLIKILSKTFPEKDLTNGS